MNEEAYKFLTSSIALTAYIGNCDSSVAKIFQSVARLEQRQEEPEAIIDRVKNTEDIRDIDNTFERVVNDMLENMQ